MLTVSIITALHNKGPFIVDTLRSVRAQTLSGWEMIVVENGSTDDGPEQVEVAAREDLRIRLIRAPNSVRGPGAARNLGLNHAIGEWILFLDADDLIEPGYLEARLGNSPGADIVAGPWTEFADGQPGNLTRRFPNGWDGSFAPDELAFCFTPWILHAAVTRREHIRKFGGWNESLDGWPSEDCTFWFRALQGARIGWSEHDGALYRRAIAGSRDDHSRNRERAFEGCRANLRANQAILAGLGKSPSSTQAATAFRVLRDQLAHASDNPSLGQRIRKEARAWLARTSWFDPRMLVWRLIFR